MNMGKLSGGSFQEDFLAACFSAALKPGINKVRNRAEAFKSRRIVAAAAIKAATEIIYINPIKRRMPE